MKADHDSGLVAGSGVLAASSTVSEDSVEQLLRSCLLHLPRRSVPPSWSRRDWQQEVEQVVALAIMRALDDFHPARGEDPERFVFRRVDREVRNRQRREWAFGRRSQPMDDASRLDFVVGPHYPCDELQQAILQLPERQRLAVVLRYFGDLSLAEIAAAMGCAVGTVKSTLHSALARLEVELDDDIEEVHDAS